MRSHLKKKKQLIEELIRKSAENSLTLEEKQHLHQLLHRENNPKNRAIFYCYVILYLVSKQNKQLRSAYKIAKPVQNATNLIYNEWFGFTSPN